MEGGQRHPRAPGADRPEVSGLGRAGLQEEVSPLGVRTEEGVPLSSEENADDPPPWAPCSRLQPALTTRTTQGAAFTLPFKIKP